MRIPHFHQLVHADPAAEREGLIAGLLAHPAVIAPKHFYDPLGSRLFAAITELPEYYPTRTEAAIFARYGEVMAQAVNALGGAPTLVDLGAGNCEKAARLFSVFAVERYVAVDISVSYLRSSLDCLQRQFQSVEMFGLGMDFSHGLRLPADIGDAPRLIFYPGSSIGNFMPVEALDFLRHAQREALGGALLIGVDLVKAESVLEPAYDDALGVTAAFNRNVLVHVNHLIQSDFALTDWAHVAHFQRDASRIEMHLQAERACRVRWPGGERVFAAGERIHTENSYKWTVGDFSDLLINAGFSGLRHWCDEENRFAVFLASAR